MTEDKNQLEAENIRRIAVENSARHICHVMNSTFGDFMVIPLTPSLLIDRLLMCDDLADGKRSETMGTLRGLQQRMRNLQLALQGKPGKTWLEYWSKQSGNPLPSRIHLTKLVEESILDIDR